MDQELSHQDDLRARRDAMRERLRLQAERVLEAVEEMGDPKSFLEVERAARAIIATDKMFEQVFREPKPRSFAPRHDYSRHGRGAAAKASVEKVGYAPSAATNAAPPPPSFAFAGEDDVTVEALKTEFDPEREAHANAIFAAYCEFKRLEREAEERYGLGP